MSLFRLCAVFAFGIAAIIALAGIKGISVEEIIGIIAVGLTLLTLCGPWDDFPGGWRHRVGP